VILGLKAYKEKMVSMEIQALRVILVLKAAKGKWVILAYKVCRV
jgi:hypothetical protein